MALIAALASSSYPVLDELDRMAALSLWPEFRPAEIPVAYFNGRATVLYRHPELPEGFYSISARIHTAVLPGRHPAVTANSSAEIAGRATATALFDAAALRNPRRAAGVLLHEAFHVWAAERHPDCTANELDFFTYPLDSPRETALAALEMRNLFDGAGARGVAGEAQLAARALDDDGGHVDDAAAPDHFGRLKELVVERDELDGQPGVARRLGRLEQPGMNSLLSPHQLPKTAVTVAARFSSRIPATVSGAGV